MQYEFKNIHNLEKRQTEALRIRKKYPDRIPVIVEKAKRSTISTIDKCKYLVPADITLGNFMFIIRKRIQLKPEEALFMFVGNTVPSAVTLMSTLYKNHVDDDGFLYIIYSGESTFGENTSASPKTATPKTATPIQLRSRI